MSIKTIQRAGVAYQVCDLESLSGYLILSAGSLFLRVVDPLDKTKYEDIEILHDDLKIQIFADSLAKLYKPIDPLAGELAFIDHSPEVLGTPLS